MESEYQIGKGHRLPISDNSNTESSSESSPLAIESFSDSWLTSNYQGKSISTLVIKTQEHIPTNFYFDVPISKSSDDEDVLVDADKIFSNGLMKPVFQGHGHDLYDECYYFYSSSSSPGPAVYSPSPAGAPVADVRYKNVGLVRWRKSSEKVVRRCIGYFRLLFTSKRSGRVDDIDRRSLEVKSRTSSAPSTPSRTRPKCGRSDSDNSIYETVLHCKRSINR